MDSHLIAGVYSQQFRQTDENSLDNDRVDAINKAKRLSQETNRRRKLQAHKRQLQAKREEQRRHDILTRRRDEQRLATEKYQRSHLPPSARQNYRPVGRTFGGTTLDTALQLIRGGFPHHNRPISSHERFLSLADENVDLLNSSFNKLRPHSSRPASGWVCHQLDPKERAELLNYSKQNLTASKTLFEQQLEQQQSFLLKQQQQYLNDFTNAVNSEIHGRNTFETTGHQYNDDGDAVEKVGDILYSNSCSSIDSLDEDKSTDLNDNKFNYAKHVMSPSRHTTVHIYHSSENDRNIKKYMNIPQQQQKQELTKQHQEPELDQQQQQQQQILASIALPSEQKEQNNVQHKNVNSFTLSQKNGSLLDGAKNEAMPISDASNYKKQNQDMPHVAVASYNDAPRSNKVIHGDHKAQQNYQSPLKQFSTDSLYSGSSSNNVSLMKHQGAAEKLSKSSHNIPPQSIEIGSNFSMCNINNNFVTETVEANQNTYRHLYSENNNFSGQTASPYSFNIQPKLSQVAWVSPSQVESKGTPISVNEHKQIDEHCKSHFASDKSTLSSSSTQSQMPMSVASTNDHSYNVESSLASVTVSAPSVSLPARFIPNSSIYTLAGSQLNAAEKGRKHGIEPSKNLTTAAVTNIEMKNNDASYLGISTHPQSDSQDYRNIVSNYNQKQVQIYNYLPQMNTPSIGIQQTETREVLATDKQMSKQSSPFQNGTSAGVNSLIHQDTQNYYKQWANDNASTSTAPSYAGRSNYPVSRPPSPVTSTAIVTAHPKLPAAQAGAQPVFSVSRNEITRNTSTKGLKNDLHDAAKENIEDNLFVDEDSDDMRPLRGILKQTHARNIPHHQEKAPSNRPYVRDSLELAHLHNDKKSKKKSVRFANHHGKDDNESSEDGHSERQSDVNTGLSSYKTSFDRPYSTKTTSASNSETNIRVQRALSAGAYRQQSMMSEHVQIQNDQQISSSSVPTSEVTSAAAYTNILQERSNLPTSFVNPLNTTPIHRPKAAAHIIMSTDKKNEASKGHNDTPSSAYKSHLETKIKPVNNNFMSKLPTKVVASKESNIVVCNAAYLVHNEEIPNSYSNKVGAHAVAEDSVLPVSQDLPQQQNYDKPRNAYSSLKHVSFSNVLPGSKKISYPQPNGGFASFSTSSNNVVYEKGGIRIDRTPTDDEITWLWDKVRNCLSKESGNRSNLPANGNGDQGSRQPPTLSTKLIDGTTLGLDTHNNGASDSSSNVKTGSGIFQQQIVSVTNPQNSAKAVLQPQGSYLKRYSLLKQRRANSASTIRNNAGPDGQRAGGAFYGRNSTIPVQQTSSVISQQVQDRPTPMMFGYKPQDEVSESTAAFIIAERLAKQSLSDSQIQVAMEDAHSKQEAHNRSRMTVIKNGHSALSIEEQKLLESLDRLNEKLKEPSFKASMNHSQATQTQFSGFQGHRPIVDMRRHMLLSPGMLQRRAQSARPRQQTYFYR